MLIKCIFNSGKKLPINARCLSETDNTDYSFLEIGTEYIVYGLMFLPYRVDYLICPNNSNPVWIPSNLCEVKDDRLPRAWSICITSLNNNYRTLYDNFNIQSLIGYSELVNSISHYIGILEREKNALELFFLAKKKIDIEHKINELDIS